MDDVAIFYGLSGRAWPDRAAYRLGRPVSTEVPLHSLAGAQDQFALHRRLWVVTRTAFSKSLVVVRLLRFKLNLAAG